MLIPKKKHKTILIKQMCNVFFLFERKKLTLIHNTHKKKTNKCRKPSLAFRSTTFQCSFLTATVHRESCVTTTTTTILLSVIFRLDLLSTTSSQYTETLPQLERNISDMVFCLVRFSFYYFQLKCIPRSALEQNSQIFTSSPQYSLYTFLFLNICSSARYLSTQFVLFDLLLGTAVILTQ